MSGPRQTMGWPSGTKNWIEIDLHAVALERDDLVVRRSPAAGPSTPSIIGMFGPVMSASSRPTRRAGLGERDGEVDADTVLLPTPPLPDATAITFLTPGTSCSGRARRGAADGGAPRRSRAPRRPSGASARRTSASIWSLSGQAGVVSSMVKATSDAVDREVADHLAGHEIAAELGLLDGAEGVEDGGLGDRGHGVGSLQRAVGPAGLPRTARSHRTARGWWKRRRAPVAACARPSTRRIGSPALVLRAPSAVRNAR